MNTLRAKSFLGVFLSLMLLCAPISAHKQSQKKSEGRAKIALKIMGRMLSCCLDCVGLYGTYYISSEGYNDGEYVNIIGSCLILGIPSWRCLRYDFKELKALRKRYKELGRVSEKSKNKKK